MLSPAPEVTGNKRSIIQSPCLLEIVIQEGGKASTQINKMYGGHGIVRHIKKMLLWGPKKEITSVIVGIK